MLADLLDPNARTCAGCRHRLRYGTCGGPVRAGLAPTFSIRWPAAGYATICSTFEARAAVTDAPDRPYRLTRAEGDAAHAEPWNEAGIARFVARVSLFLMRRFNGADAHDLAERLHLRDAQGDDRRLSVECQHLSGRPGAWRCENHRFADIQRELAGDLVTLPQCCGGFDSGR